VYGTSLSKDNTFLSLIDKKVVEERRYEMG
jgi:hypothetical protein